MRGAYLHAPDALREAQGILGVRRDVIVQSSFKLGEGDAGRFEVLGRYCGMDIHGFHRIVLKAHQPTRQAHAMLLHELVHAAQTERCGSHARFVSEYNRQLVEAGIDPSGRRTDAWYEAYRNIPFEREAYYVQRKATDFRKIIRRKPKQGRS